MDGRIILLRSKLKMEILKAVSKEPLTPTMISKLIRRPRPSVSRGIRELEKAGFVRCLDPTKDRWRLYQITNIGEKILKEAMRFR